MEKEMQAGVIVRTKFVDGLSASKGQKETFASYINYINRSEATRNEKHHSYNLIPFDNYNAYMANPNKTGGLFTANKDSLSFEDKKHLQKQFKTSYDNQNILWQSVVSFDNRFLEELGIYDRDTRAIDETKLRNATRALMRTTLEKENMTNTAVWSAAIHYNTKHIHIHIAFVEPINTRKIKIVDGQKRPRGRFHEATIRAMKSKMVNYLLENEYTKLDYLARERFVKGAHDNTLTKDRKLRKQFKAIHRALEPYTRDKWKYNMNVIKDVRPMIDKLSRDYLDTYHAGEFCDFQRMIAEKQALYMRAYGQNSQYAHYAENKTKDLFTRMGNAILSEMRAYDKNQKENIRRKDYVPDTAHSLNLSASLSKLKSSLNKAFYEQDKQNEYEHQKLQHDIEMSQ